MMIWETLEMVYTGAVFTVNTSCLHCFDAVSVSWIS